LEYQTQEYCIQDFGVCGALHDGSQSSYPSLKFQIGVNSSINTLASYPIRLKAILKVEHGLIRFSICGPICNIVALVDPSIRRKLSSEAMANVWKMRKQKPNSRQNTKELPGLEGDLTTTNVL
jgi:hypothetical protein